MRYQYFLKSDAVMSSDHNNWDTQHGACMSTQYDDAVILSLADTVTRCNVLCVGFLPHVTSWEKAWDQGGLSSDTNKYADF